MLHRLDLVVEFEGKSRLSLFILIRVTLEFVHPQFSPLSQRLLDIPIFGLLVLYLLLVFPLLAFEQIVHIVEILYIVVQLDALLLSLVNQILCELFCIENGLQACISQVFLEDHLVERILKQSV